MKFYTALFYILTAVTLTAADAVTSATPQYQTSEDTAKPAVRKAVPEKKKKAAVKKTVPAKKKKAAVNKNRKNDKKTPVPASVNISSFAPDAKDATAALEKAIRTRAKEIVFDKAGTYFLRPVKLRGRMQFILKDGVKIIALAPEKAEKSLPGLFTIDNVSRIVFKGSRDNTITVPQGVPAFSIKNSNNIELRDLMVENSSSGIKMVNCYGVKMYNLVFDTLAQTALEIDGGNWNSIYDSQFRNLAGTGVVVVAGKDGKLPNMTFDNCEFFNSNSGLALRRPEKISAKAPDKKARPARFDIRSCRFFNNSGIDMELCGELTFGNIRIDNNLFNNKVNTALKLVNFSTAPDAVTLQVNNCSFNPGDTNLKTPIVCMGTSDLPVGNIKFTNTAVASPVHKKAICFDLKKKSGKLEGILPVIAADGSRLNAILTVEEK
ncbi:MAG: right-handed parallel beta-helix repeat-containing protein [Lentisphaerae bacterium]|nr:right-handed parallel beta-helix repeat-containing protein [Lentisphaerota bacterium]